MNIRACDLCSEKNPEYQVPKTKVHDGELPYYELCKVCIMDVIIFVEKKQKAE